MHWKTIIALCAICLFSTSIYAQDNVALNKPVFEIGEAFGAGDWHDGVPPDVVTDGNFLPPGDDWFNGSWWLAWECAFIPPHPPGDPPPPPEPCALEIDLEGWFRIDSFIFQGDSDWYSLDYWNMDLGTWQLAWEVPGTWGYVQVRPYPNNSEYSEKYVLPAPIVTNRLRIMAIPQDPGHPESDGWSSVSEIQAFGEPTEPPPPPPPPFVDCLELICFESEESWEAFLTDEVDFCYKVELTCGDRIGGGVRLNLHPDGRVEGEYGFFIPEEPNDCGGFIAHLGNEKIVHSCAFNSGEIVELEIKSDRMHRCRKEVALCEPPPPPPPPE